MDAKDGVIGEVTEFYFDDQTWTVRYLIVKTGSWLSGRKVLISPVALIKGARQNGFFPVNLTKEQIMNSPDIDTDEPVSRRHEIELYNYYAWDNYWGSGFYGGGYMLPAGSFAPFEQEIEKASAGADRQPEGEQHLRSSERVTGYHIHAANGDIGHVADFILEENGWKINFIVVDTHNWIGGKKVLIGVKHIKEIEWENSKLFLDITTAAVEKCKLFNKSDYSIEGTDEQIRVHVPIIPDIIH
jgi:uncharacterized protein YrrD